MLFTIKAFAERGKAYNQAKKNGGNDFLANMVQGASNNQNKTYSSQTKKTKGNSSTNTKKIGKMVTTNK